MVLHIMTQQIKCYVTINAATMQAECAYLGIQTDDERSTNSDSLYQYKTCNVCLQYGVKIEMTFKGC